MIVNMNCQSISAKRNRFLMEIDSSQPDVIIGTELWFSPNNSNGEVFPSNYQVFRRDRPGDAHGGVFIAVNDSFVASEVPDIQQNCENTCVAININWVKSLSMAAFYHPLHPTRITSVTWAQKSRK